MPTPIIQRCLLLGLTWPVGLGWVLGGALQLQQSQLSAPWVYMLFMALALVVVWLAATQFIANWRRPVLLILAMAALAWGVTGLRAGAFMAQSLAPALQGVDLAVTGVVVGLPQRQSDRLRFRLRAESAQAQGQAVRLPPLIDLGWYESWGARPAPQIQAGERWQFTVRLKAPHGARNPHGFDLELWLWEQGVQASGYVRNGAKDPLPQRLAQTGMHPLDWARQQVRDRILAHVPEPAYAGLIAALVTGDQGAIERAEWDVFRATGVSHLVAISGLHITMFAWLMTRLMGALWRRSTRLCLWVPAPQAGLVAGVLLASAYALFSGWGLPAQRTVLMLACAALLRLSGRQWPWPQVWLLVFAVVVALDPWALLQAGFWLSFVAVGILFASDAGHAPERRPGAIGRLRAMLREQWVITLALTPLSLLLFGQVSLVGLLANVLAIPWVTLIVTPLAMLGVLVPLLWSWAAQALAALVWGLTHLAAWPLASVSVAQAPLWAGAVGVLGGLGLILPLPWRLRLMGLPLLLPVALWQAPVPPVGEFELLAADVGQGSAVLIRTAHYTLLFDAGPRYSQDSDAGHRVLVPLLRALGRPLDLLVLSHRDTDHVGGAAAVLASQPQAGVLSSIEATHALQAVRPATRCEAGQRWHRDGVDFEVLHPLASDYTAGATSNALSCTLRISNGTHAVLLTGDIERAQEAQLVARTMDLNADVLLVPHHGSQTSSSDALIEAVMPRFALVQSGYRNRYGHPARAVLVRYAERQVEVLNSPHCGAAVWQSRHPGQVQCQRTLMGRYWHDRVP